MPPYRETRPEQRAIQFYLPKSEYDAMATARVRTGESMTAFVRKAIAERVERAA